MVMADPSDLGHGKNTEIFFHKNKNYLKKNIFQKFGEMTIRAFRILKKYLI